MIIRIAVIVVAIFVSFCVYSFIVRPFILEPLCLVNSNGCVRMAYYSYNNSALVHMRNTGIWLWFNGDRAFVYGQPVGQLCNDPRNYEAAYSINTRTGLKEGYKCVISLSQAIEFYESKGIKMNYIVKRAGTADNFDVYAALNLLDNEGIINLSTSS